MLSTKASMVMARADASGSTRPYPTKSQELSPTSPAMVVATSSTARGADSSDRPKASSSPVTSTLSTS
ncbi:Uncharacterised protein [Mycobacterium tuberculosis]|nr:Uncharacterised protein [Mycobacterium tuberculosis]